MFKIKILLLSFALMCYGFSAIQTHPLYRFFTNGRLAKQVDYFNVNTKLIHIELQDAVGYYDEESKLYVCDNINIFIFYKDLDIMYTLGHFKCGVKIW